MKISVLTASVLLAFIQLAHAGSATWNLNPTNKDWNLESNWTPATVPNGPTDIATFQISNKRAVSVTDNTEVNEIIFGPGASAFSISSSTTVNGIAPQLTISGAGVTNNSGMVQNFVAVGGRSILPAIAFTNSATAGENSVYTTVTVEMATNPLIQFSDNANAGNSTFVTSPAINGGGSGEVLFNGNSTAETATFTNMGFIEFFDTASAANATIMNDGGAMGFNDTSTAANAVMQGVANIGFGEFATVANASFDLDAGSVVFIAGAADNGTFTLGGSATDTLFGAEVEFTGAATAANGIFDLAGGMGGTPDGFTGAEVLFFDTSSGGDAILTANGGTVADARGAIVLFSSDGAGSRNCTAANSILIANGGVNGGLGGTIQFLDNSFGGTARIEVFGNGNLDISDRDTFNVVTIGSLEGDGLVFLGPNTLRIGANNLDTVFSGTAQDGGGIGGTGHGSLTKSGMGTLTLSGANTYTGNTALFSGALLVRNTTGSGTGTGGVTVNGGTLGGSGIIAGAVTVSGPAFLAPAFGTNKQFTLTMQSNLTLQTGSTYTYSFKARNSQLRTDLVQANGITINGATIRFKAKTQGTLAFGTVLTVLSNASANPINGTFSNLADGAIVAIDGNNFQANYGGGDGNDLTLTVVP
jgi:autotransporter-associated beta strand protein